MNDRCFQCRNAEKVFFFFAEEMIGGSYKCKFTGEVYNGRSRCHIPISEKQEFNGILHQTCRYCVKYASYCTKHDKEIDDVFWDDTCINFMWKNINGANIMHFKHPDVIHNYELKQLDNFEKKEGDMKNGRLVVS